MIRSRLRIVFLALVPLAVLGSVTWNAWAQYPNGHGISVRITPFPKGPFYTPPSEPFYQPPSTPYYQPAEETYYAPADQWYQVPYSLPDFSFAPPVHQVPRLAPMLAKPKFPPPCLPGR